MSHTSVIVPDSGESSSLCRLCAEKRENCVNIFISHGVHMSTVEETIRDLISLKVVEGDGLPCTACLQCFGKLLEFRDFKEMCLMSDIKLRKSAVGSNFKCTLKEEEEHVESTIHSHRSNSTTHLVQDASNFGNPCLQTIEGCVKVEVNWKETIEEDEISEEDRMGKNMSIDADHVPAMEEWDEMVPVKEEVLPDHWLDNEERVSCFSIAPSESSACIPRDPLTLDSVVVTKDDISRDPLGESEDCSDDKIEETAKDVTVYWEFALGGQADRFNADVDTNSSFESSQSRNKVMQVRGHCQGRRQSDLPTQSDDGPYDLSPKLGKKPPIIEVSRKLNVLDSGIEEGKGPVGAQSSRLVKKEFGRRLKSPAGGGKTHWCGVCEKTFSQSSNLHKHMLTHSGEKPFICNICSKSFTQKVSLQAHNRIHSGEKPFTCNVCSKSFSRKYNLRTHLRIHRGERPYACITCSKTFIQNNALTTHMRVHSGEKPYSCTICNKSFTQGSSLRAHSVIHSGDKPFKCSLCLKSFAACWSLKKHLRTHSGERI